MTKIGITGSIASGKSTVVKFLSGNKYPVFSADKVVKKLYQNKNFAFKIKKKFNLKNSKNLKNKIKNHISKDKNTIRKLELLIHPQVRKKMKLFMIRNRKKKLLIFEIPLLIESKLNKYFDLVLFVGAKKTIRLKRFLSSGGSKKIFTILEKRQSKPKKKISMSDHVIYNNNSIKVLKKNVKVFLKRYV